MTGQPHPPEKQSYAWNNMRKLLLMLKGRLTLTAQNFAAYSICTACTALLPRTFISSLCSSSHCAGKWYLLLARHVVIWSDDMRSYPYQ